MENKNFKKGIEEIKDIKMTSLEKEAILGNVLNSPAISPKPIKSPYNFTFKIKRGYLSYYAMAFCLLLVILSGGKVLNSLNNKNTGNLASVPNLNQANNIRQENLNILNNKEVAKNDDTLNPNKKIAKKSTVISASPQPDGSLSRNTNNGGGITSSTPTVGVMMAPGVENQTKPITEGLKKAFNLYKNGQILECQENGQTYYSAMFNAYDGGGKTFDITGRVVGEYQGFTGAYFGIHPENCEKIYIISPNIWGLEGLNKYNLK